MKRDTDYLIKLLSEEELPYLTLPLHGPVPNPRVLKQQTHVQILIDIGLLERCGESRDMVQLTKAGSDTLEAFRNGSLTEYEFNEALNQALFLGADISNFLQFLSA